MKLRPLLGEDLPPMAEIEAHCSPSPWGKSMLEEALGLGGTWSLGAEEGGLLAGFCLLYRVLDEWQLMTLCVLPEHRRQGIARQLLEEAKQAAQKEGAQKLSLEVRKGNTAALGLYIQAGFVQVGLRKAYYQDGEDALLMDCPLGEGRDLTGEGKMCS